MADTKLTDLTEVSVPDLLDWVYLVDKSDTTDDAAGSSRKASLTRSLGMLNHVCQGRLTLTSGTPVTTTDVTGATNVYFTPYNGNCVSLYDGTRWRMYTFSELTLALGTLTAFQGYDVYLYDNSGTLTLEAAEWQNATVTMTIATPCVVTWTAHGLVTGNSITFTNSGGALPTGVSANTQYWITKIDANTFKLSTNTVNLGVGTFVNSSGSQSGTHTGHSPTARQTAYVLQDGVPVKSGAATRRLLGSFMTTSTTTTEDSLTKRFLSNLYNQQFRTLFVCPAYSDNNTTTQYTYSGSVWIEANAGTNSKVQIFQCIAGSYQASASAYISPPSLQYAAVGLGEDSSSTSKIAPYTSAGLAAALIGNYYAQLTLGYHYLALLVVGTNAGTYTVNADAIRSGGTADSYETYLTGGIYG